MANDWWLLGMYVALVPLMLFMERRWPASFSSDCGFLVIFTAFSMLQLVLMKTHPEADWVDWLVTGCVVGVAVYFGCQAWSKRPGQPGRRHRAGRSL